MSLASRGLVRVVRSYQRVWSPHKPVPTCRFTPSCSEYAAQAIERHGAVRGGWLTAWRVMRCNPLVPGGYDPVPEQFLGRPGSELSGTSPPAAPPASSTKSPPPKKRPVS